MADDIDDWKIRERIGHVLAYSFRESISDHKSGTIISCTIYERLGN